MDFATIGGIVLGLYLVVFWGIGDPAKIALFIDIPSVALTIGGAVSGLFVAYPLSSLLGIGSVIKKTFIVKKANEVAMIKQIVALAESARKEGLLALEGKIPNIEDEFLRRSLQMVIDGTDQAVVDSVMQIEMDNMDNRHKGAAQLFDDFAALAPAFGMVGTLVGLVLMLANMADPSSIGPAMAIALITTFYGALVANLFFTPWAMKLKGYNAGELHMKSIIKDGVIALQNGENPRLIESKLLSYLSPAERLKAQKEGGK